MPLILSSLLSFVARAEVAGCRLQHTIGLRFPRTLRCACLRHDWASDRRHEANDVETAVAVPMLARPSVMYP